jgi:hypothetical protein
MNYESINESLENKIPEIMMLQETKDIKDYYINTEIHSHIFYSQTINPLIHKLLVGEILNVDLEKKVFSFLEEMANSTDELVTNLLQVTILESLWDTYEILNKAEQLMGPQTKLLNQNIATYLRKPI